MLKITFSMSQDYSNLLTTTLSMSQKSFKITTCQLIPSYRHHVLAESCGCITSTSAHVDQPSSHISYSSDIPLFQCLGDMLVMLVVCRIAYTSDMRLFRCFGNMLVMLVVCPLLCFLWFNKLRDQYQAAICPLYLGFVLYICSF